MSSALKTAIVQQALDTSNLYLRNAALKHGVPETAFVPRLWSEDKESSASTVTTSTTNQTQPQVPPTQAASPVVSSGLKTAALVGLSLLSGGSLTGLALTPWLMSKAPAVLPKEDETEKGLLLPWLEEQGLNQPEAK